MQKLVSAVTIMMALTAGLMGYADIEQPSPLPSVRAATNLSETWHEPRFEEGEQDNVIQTTSMLTIIGQAPKAPGKVWTCSEPRALANDASQTVRTCEWL